MRRRILNQFALSALAVVCATSLASAAYYENFQSYPIGSGVVASSAGAWSYWGLGPSGTDALVVADPLNSGNHALNITNNGGGSPDVTTAFPNLFAGGNSTATLSFDIYMTSPNLDSGPQINIGPVDLNFGNYGNTQVIYANDSGSLAGTLSGGIATYPPPGTVFGDFATDAWNHVEVDMKNTGGVGGALTFSLSVNGGAPIAAGSTTLTANGITTLEAAAFSTANSSNSFVLIDNIRAYPTPEPASLLLALVALAGMCGYGWRRRHAA